MMGAVEQRTGDTGVVGSPAASAHERAHDPLQALGLDDAALAQYDGIIARLLFASESERFALAVTSSVPGEGVTATSLGIACALAASTSGNVLLVDANLRRPSLHDRLGMPSAPGLHELVAATRQETGPVADVRDEPPVFQMGTFRTRVAPNLWLMPAGAPAPHPAQLLTSDAARHAVGRLKSYFDFVVTDCPPVLSAIDAGVTCRLSSGVVLVVRAGATPREQVKLAQETLRGVPLLGVVLNGV